MYAFVFKVAGLTQYARLKCYLCGQEGNFKRDCSNSYLRKVKGAAAKSVNEGMVLPCLIGTVRFRSEWDRDLGGWNWLFEERISLSCCWRLSGHTIFLGISQTRSSQSFENIAAWAGPVSLGDEWLRSQGERMSERNMHYGNKVDACSLGCWRHSFRRFLGYECHSGIRHHTIYEVRYGSGCRKRANDGTFSKTFVVGFRCAVHQESDDLDPHDASRPGSVCRRYESLVHMTEGIAW